MLKKKIPSLKWKNGELEDRTDEITQNIAQKDDETGKVRYGRHTHCCSCCCWVASVVSDSVPPHSRQPTRLPRPWDSPGKNAGVGCHFLLQSMKVKSENEVTQSWPTLSDPMDCSPSGSSIHGIFQATALKWGASALCLRRSLEGERDNEKEGNIWRILGWFQRFW